MIYLAHHQLNAFLHWSVTPAWKKAIFLFIKKKKTSHEQTPDNYGLISQFFFLSFNFFFFDVFKNNMYAEFLI